MLERMYLWRMPEETRFPYMVYTRHLCSCSTSWWWFSRPTMHRDDVSCLCLPGLHLWGAESGEECQEIENDMDSYCWHFLDLKAVNLRTCAQKRLSLHAWGHTLKWRQLMLHGRMHREKKEVFKCAPTTLSKLFIILSWHSPLMTQGRLTVMQDLASHKLGA